MRCLTPLLCFTCVSSLLLLFSLSSGLCQQVPTVVQDHCPRCAVLLLSFYVCVASLLPLFSRASWTLLPASSRLPFKPPSNALVVRLLRHCTSACFSYTLPFVGCVLARRPTLPPSPRAIVLPCNRACAIASPAASPAASVAYTASGVLHALAAFLDSWSRFTYPIPHFYSNIAPFRSYPTIRHRWPIPVHPAIGIGRAIYLLFRLLDMRH